MKVTVKTTGFADLDRALSQIEKASTAKGVMRRALIKAAQPMADMAESLAPDDPNTPGQKIKIGNTTHLSRRQKRLHRRMFKNDKAAVETFVGAAPHPAAHTQEFGTAPHIAGGMFAGAKHPGNAPQPFMRPAWDQEAMPTLGRLGKEMWSEVEKQAKRAAKRAAKAAKG